jgi:hypothetical protein
MVYAPVAADFTHAYRKDTEHQSATGGRPSAGCGAIRVSIEVCVSLSHKPHEAGWHGVEAADTDGSGGFSSS